MGTGAPRQVRRLVVLPSSLQMTTALLKLPELVGAKLTNRFVEPKPARLKGVPDKRVNGPLVLATPLLRTAPPWLVRTRVACTLEPAAIVPKSRLGGVTASRAGVKPEPATLLVLLP